MKNKKAFQEFLDSLDDISESIGILQKEIYIEGQSLLNSLDRSVSIYILSTLLKACKDEVSYRYLMYDSLDLDPSAYGTLQIAGLLEWNNECENISYNIDISSSDVIKGESIYLDLSVNDRISLIAYLVKNDFIPLENM